MLPITVITLPTPWPGEEAAVRALLAAGCADLVWRRPGSAEAAVARQIAALPPDLRDAVSVHTHAQVAADLGCGGVHLPEALAATAPGSGARGLRWGLSLHDPTTLGQWQGLADRVLLAPMFPSHSKPGHGVTGALRRDLVEPVLRSRLCPPVVALGGVDPDRLPEVAAWGFAGAAVLGWLWGEAGDRTPQAVVRRWRELQSAPGPVGG